VPSGLRMRGHYPPRHKPHGMIQCWLFQLLTDSSLVVRLCAKFVMEYDDDDDDDDG
jgi:hypothetical protein